MEGHLSINEYTKKEACEFCLDMLNTFELTSRSALLSRVEAMDDYRHHMRAMVHHVQLNYLNSQRLSLERNKASRQLRRLKRIQYWLYYEKVLTEIALYLRPPRSARPSREKTEGHILRQNLYEVCPLSEANGRNHQNFYALDSSICYRIRQEQQRRQQSPYSNLGSRKPEKSTYSFMSSQDQLKLPLCAFLHVQSMGSVSDIKTLLYNEMSKTSFVIVLPLPLSHSLRCMLVYSLPNILNLRPGVGSHDDALNSSLNPRERHTVLGAEKSTSILSEQELRQLHQMFFKNSTFASFLTSLYRLLFTTLLLSMCICWLLACKHLIMQMASRTVAVVTSRVTVISPCPPASRRIETFIHSSDSSLSFHRPSIGGGVTSARLNIWHSDDDPCEDLQNPLCSLPPDPPPHGTTPQLLPGRKKSKKHMPHFRGKPPSQGKSATQSDSNESHV
ncbi:hypothetical protein ACTXT7_002283 [Hymenolepis weldensis]